MLDYLNNDNKEVKKAFSQIRDTERALQKTVENYRPSVLGERYLTGDEVCDYLHISPRTLQTLRDTRRYLTPLLAGGYFSTPKPEYVKPYIRITAPPKTRSKSTNGQDTTKPGRNESKYSCVPVFRLYNPA